MALRSLSTGTISFGLVSIPVRLYSATQPSAGLSFNLLHKACGSRLRQQYLCAKEGVPVAREDMVKGYEFAKDQYVVLAPEELKELEEASSPIIEITEFVPAETVDPVHLDKPYYLGPDKGGAKAYRLLSAALREAGKAAIARHAARGKGYLVLIRPHGDGLVMQQLLWADEVRPFADVPMDAAEVKPEELKLALALVEQTTSDAFHPERYRDEVRARVQALIERKIAGQQIQPSQPEAPRAQVIDLLEALKASIAASGGAKAAPTTAAAAPAPEAPPDEAAGEGERRPAKRAARRDEKPAARGAGGRK